MRVQVVLNDGEVICDLDTDKVIKDQEKEFPNDGEDTHRELAIEDILHDVKIALNYGFNKRLEEKGD